MLNPNDISADKPVEPAPPKGPDICHTKGQFIHRWGTYLSVDWVFNAAVGVSFAYWGKFTESGKKFWSGPITDGFKKVLSPVIKNPGQLEKSAAHGNMFMSIIAGGMFTIPPLMILESKKVKKSIVKTLDKLFYGAQTVENDPKFQEVYDHMDHAPKKDFTNGMLSRFAALSPLLAIVLIPQSKRVADKAWFSHVEKASEVTFEKAGINAEKMFKKSSPEQRKARWKFIHESVAMDFGLGIPYAVLHSIAYNWFVSRKGEKPSVDDEPQTPLISASLEQTEAQPEAAAVKKIERKTQFTDYAKANEQPGLGVS